MVVENSSGPSRTLSMLESGGFYVYCPSVCFEVTDEDAGDFLQSQFTNELRPFDSGRASYGLWLDLKAKVIGDGVVLCHGAEQFSIISEGSDAAILRAHLERHIIADDVSIATFERGPVFELPGAVCGALGLAMPALGRFEASEYGCVWHVLESHYQLMTDSESAADRLRERLIAVGCFELSASARGLQRIAAGRPLVPDEIGPKDLPGEGELECDAISFKKGCYLGQEVVARMHNIGQAQRRLFVVEGEGCLPTLPLPVFIENSKLVGEVRTAYVQGGGWRGVALLKRRFVDSGDLLRAEGMDVSVVRALREVTAL
ncbi:MAG: folate-binding protein [Puniceicoccaceae bacterium]|nr:MAG: folate-binding protein [Puniceicoccaceae bacterium]